MNKYYELNVDKNMDQDELIKKLTDNIFREEVELDERPMGIIGKLGSKAKTLVPGRTGRRATGELEVGKLANEISDKFDLFLGQVGGADGATPVSYTHLRAHET